MGFAMPGARPVAAHVLRAAAFEWRLAWGRRRLRFTLCLDLLPIAVAVIGVVLQRAGTVTVQATDALAEVVGVVYMMLMLVVPLVFGTGLVGPDAEAHTLVYLLVRPLGRGSLLLGKFLGGWLAATVPLALSLVVTALVMPLGGGGGELRGWYALLPRFELGLCLGTLAYGALFTLVGLAFARPAVVALFLAFGWESAVPFLPGWIKTLSVRHHLAAILPAEGLPAGLLAALDPPGALAATTWLLFGTLVTLTGSVCVFARRDYP